MDDADDADDSTQREAVCSETIELLLESADRGTRASVPGAAASHCAVGPADGGGSMGSDGSGVDGGGGRAEAGRGRGGEGGGVESSSRGGSRAPGADGAGGAGGVGGRFKWQPVMLSAHSLQLAVDLLPACKPHVLRSALEALGERLVPSAPHAADMARLWRHVGGVPLLLKLALHPDVSSGESVASDQASGGGGGGSGGGSGGGLAATPPIELILGARRGPQP